MPVQFPCVLCSKCVSVRHKVVLCDICENWVHKKCANISNQNYELLSSSTEPWFCTLCLCSALPFLNLSCSSDTSNVSNSSLLNLKYTVDNTQIPPTDSVSDNTSPIISSKYFEVSELRKVFTNSTKLSLFHLNISSLPLHFDDLNNLLNSLDHRFDFIGITETRISTPHIPNDICLDNFSYFHTPSDCSNRGALIYYQKHLNVIKRPDLDKILFKSRQLESIFIELPKLKGKNLIVSCIYKHPSLDIDEFCNEYFEPFLHCVTKEKKDIILMGDFNINFLRIDIDREVSNFFDHINSSVFFPYVNIPTRVTPTSETLIDNIFSNFLTSSNPVSGNLISGISDHFPQFVLLDHNFSSPSNLNQQFIRNWKKFDHHTFLTDFSNIDWKETLRLQADNVNFSFDNFFNVITNLIDKHVPFVKPSNNKRYSSKPWITTAIRQSIITRDNIYKQFLKEKDKTVKESIFQQYKNHRNAIVSLCRTSKNNFYLNFFSVNVKNTKKIWEGINNLVSRGKNSKSRIQSLKINSNVTSDPSIIANSFNSYFTSIADKIREKIPKTPKNFKTFLI